MIRVVVSLWLFSFFISCDTPTETVDYDVQGKVVRIADGDTFTLLTEKQEQVKVRMYGIDAPERGQDYGQVARQKLSDLVFGKHVLVEQKDKDRYGRVIGIVWNGQHQNINEELLRAGLVWHYRQYDKNEAWSKLEQQARMRKTGLWAHPQPELPWEWRKKDAVMQ